MNTIQIANFVYWIQEYSNLRGISDKETPQEKFELIDKLREEFLSKYPTGVLTGWKKPVCGYDDEQYRMQA